MSVIIKDMEMPKNCSQCEIWSKCWDERPFWFERLEFCPLMEMADRKTEKSSEKPNNYCDDCLYTDTCDSKEFFYACTSKATISKMEQVEDEPQTDCPWK